YDQAHFIGDFRWLMGVTPGTVVRRGCAAVLPRGLPARVAIPVGSCVERPGAQGSKVRRDRLEHITQLDAASPTRRDRVETVHDAQELTRHAARRIGVAAMVYCE